jgi:N-glycosylase/DNA lyase
MVLHAQSSRGEKDWKWLENYLAIDEDIDAIIRTFPKDAPLSAAVQHAPGLRLLRQEPWESLASFICSSTKQIVQIQEIIRLMSARFGERIPQPGGEAPAYSFPTPEAIAAAGVLALRECKLGFRAPYLWQTAQRVVSGQLDLGQLATASTEAARAALMEAPGVGRKIADCTLLFGYGRQDAFPVDVWVRRILVQLYFKGRKTVNQKRLDSFPLRYFGVNAGYAQQYLFHYARTHGI